MVVIALKRCGVPVPRTLRATVLGCKSSPAAHPKIRYETKVHPHLTDCNEFWLVFRV